MTVILTIAFLYLWWHSFWVTLSSWNLCSPNCDKYYWTRLNFALGRLPICFKGHPSIRKYQPCLECKLFPSNYMIMHTRTIHNAIPIFKRHNRNKNKWCLCLGSDSWIKWKEKIFYTAIITFSLDANHFCNKWLNSFWSMQYINKIICNHAPKRTNL